MVAVGAVLLLSAAAVRAQPESESESESESDEDEHPWAAGVAPEAREIALAAFREGNVHFAEKEYVAAAASYREALAHWDHPAVRGNLAVTLVHLDDPLAAYEQVGLALRYGAEPFEQHAYEQLITSQKLLEGQLATVEVVCEVGGAEVALDGAGILGGKGAALSMIRVGPHQIVASKPAHLTFTHRFNAMPRETVRIEVKLIPLREAGGYERKWASWKPWTAVGAGAALVLLAVPLELAAQNNIDGYEQEITRSCPSGCNTADLPPAVLDLASRGRWQSRAAVSALITGGVVGAVGAYLVYENRLRRVRLDESGRRLSAVPQVLPHGAGVALAGWF
jgi:hypothetical protein